MNKLKSPKWIIKLGTFWDEIKFVFQTLKYSPFGYSTIEIPSFLKENLKNIAENLYSTDFQYNIFCTEMKENITNYFPKNVLERESQKRMLSSFLEHLNQFI